MQKIFVSIAVISTACIFLCPTLSFGQNGSKPSTNSSKLLITKNSIPNSFIVHLNENTVSSGIKTSRAEALNTLRSIASNFTTKYNGTLLNVYTSVFNGFSINMSEEDAKKLANEPNVKMVFSDARVTKYTTQFNTSWGLDRIDQADLPLNGFYSYNFTGAGVNLYVIDSGIRPTHSEFKGRVQQMLNFVGTGSSILANDCDGHGTHVAGIAAGTTYGVAKQANIYSLKILDCSGDGTVSDMIEAVDWVAANRKLPAVINLSSGSGAHEAVDLAVRRAIAAGIVFVAASGNSNKLANDLSPGRVGEAITVGAIDQFDKRGYFSNYGSAVDLFAPGVDIVSAGHFTDVSTATMTGTSMSAPYVAGIAALYLQANPNASPREIHQLIVGRATRDKVIDPVGSGNLIAHARQFDCTITAGSAIYPGDNIKACNDANYELRFQHDGNVVLYRRSDNRPLWATGTNGRNGAYLAMQPDGNLVLYNTSNYPIWATGTNGRQASKFFVQNDGNLVLYNPSNQPVWASGTSGW
jgi:subtilisin family serine protease